MFWQEVRVMDKENNSLESYIELIESMKMPQSLTFGFELSSKQQSVVDLCVAQVLERGFSVVSSFLDTAQLELLREGLGPIFALTGNRTVDGGKRGWPGIQTVHIPNLYAKTRAIDEVSIDPVLVSIVEGVLGQSFQMSVAVAMAPGPGCDKQGLHQDDSHYPIPRPHAPLVANTLIALDDFTIENGATMLVPGSHKWKRKLDPQEPVTRAEMKAGSLLVWDGAVWHGGGANLTKSEVRRSVNLNFNVSWLRQQENLYLGIPRKTISEMPELLQRLLGYNRVNHLCGGVDYQDPLHYFQKHSN